jgi:hypothetical protein
VQGAVDSNHPVLTFMISSSQRVNHYTTEPIYTEGEVANFFGLL